MAAPPLQLSRGIRGVSVLIGSVDPDFHRPESLNEITLIVDRGGDDCYDFLGLAPGAVLIAVDHVVDGSYVGAHRCERKIWVSGSFLFGISNEHAIDEPGTVFLLLHSIEHERCSEIESDKKDFLDRPAPDDQQPTILDTTGPINGSILRLHHLPEPGGRSEMGANPWRSELKCRLAVVKLKCGDLGLNNPDDRCARNRVARHHIL